MNNIEMPLTVNIKSPRPSVVWRYGQQLLKVPLCDLLDCPTAKQSYKEAIGYAIKDSSDRFEQLRLDGRPVEVKPWPGNGSLDVQRLHHALLDYDHDCNP
jgi:hypothetical protein